MNAGLRHRPDLARVELLALFESQIPTDRKEKKLRSRKFLACCGHTQNMSPVTHFNMGFVSSDVEKNMPRGCMHAF